LITRGGYPFPASGEIGLPGGRGAVLGAVRGSIRSYALEAERKMGQMLAETERATGAPGPGRGKPRTKPVQGFTDALPLADLGLTRKESSRAQMLADLPDETFERVKSGESPRDPGLCGAVLFRECGAFLLPARGGENGPPATYVLPGLFSYLNFLIP